MPPTDRYTLIQLRLGRDLAGYITQARRDQRSYRRIAADLRTITGMPVTYEAVRQWEQRAEGSAA